MTHSTLSRHRRVDCWCPLSGLRSASAGPKLPFFCRLAAGDAGDSGTLCMLCSAPPSITSSKGASRPAKK